MIHHAAPSWPERRLRFLLWSRRLGPGFYLACAVLIGSLAALTVWHGANRAPQRLVFVLSLIALAWAVAWYVWFTSHRVAPVVAGVQAEHRAVSALKGLGIGVEAWSNVRFTGWPYDLDLVVVTETQLVVVEVKADPGRLMIRDDCMVSGRRGATKDFASVLKQTKTRAIRFKLQLIQAAKRGALPSGIPTPHHLVAVDPLHESPWIHAGHVVHVDALADAVQALPDNLPARLREPLSAYLCKGAAS